MHWLDLSMSIEARTNATNELIPIQSLRALNILQWWKGLLGPTNTLPRRSP